MKMKPQEGYKKSAFSVLRLQAGDKRRGERNSLIIISGDKTTEK